MCAFSEGRRDPLGDDGSSRSRGMSGHPSATSKADAGGIRRTNENSATVGRRLLTYELLKSMNCQCNPTPRDNGPGGHSIWVICDIAFKYVRAHYEGIFGRR